MPCGWYFRMSRGSSFCETLECPVKEQVCRLCPGGTHFHRFFSATGCFCGFSLYVINMARRATIQRRWGVGGRWVRKALFCVSRNLKRKARSRNRSHWSSNKDSILDCPLNPPVLYCIAGIHEFYQLNLQNRD
jgi:hypothetical protein